jgi:hypothetical protein
MCTIVLNADNKSTEKIVVSNVYNSSQSTENRASTISQLA